MFRIVYVSSAVEPFSEGELRQLLGEARSRNEACRVTGMLVYSQAKFLQALEGEPAAVASTFDRISADRRHRNVKTLQRGIFSDQLFGNWAMGFHSDLKAPGQISINSRISLDALNGLTALDFLRSCSRTQTG